MVQCDMDDLFTPSNSLLDFDYDEDYASGSMSGSSGAGSPAALDFEDELLKELNSLPSLGNEGNSGADCFLNIDTLPMLDVKDGRKGALEAIKTEPSDINVDENVYNGSDFLNDYKEPTPTIPRKPLVIKTEAGTYEGGTFKTCVRNDKCYKIYIPSRKMSSNVISVNIKKPEDRSGSIPGIKRVKSRDNAARNDNYYQQVKAFKVEHGMGKTRRGGRCAMTVPPHLKTEEEIRTWKKQQRMIKNR